MSGPCLEQEQPLALVHFQRPSPPRALIVNVSQRKCHMLYCTPALGSVSHGGRGLRVLVFPNMWLGIAVQHQVMSGDLPTCTGQRQSLWAGLGSVGKKRNREAQFRERWPKDFLFLDIGAAFPTQLGC